MAAERMPRSRTGDFDRAAIEHNARGAREHPPASCRRNGAIIQIDSERLHVRLTLQMSAGKMTLESAESPASGATVGSLWMVAESLTVARPGFFGDGSLAEAAGLAAVEVSAGFLFEAGVGLSDAEGALAVGDAGGDVPEGGFGGGFAGACAAGGFSWVWPVAFSVTKAAPRHSAPARIVQRKVCDEPFMRGLLLLTRRIARCESRAWNRSNPRSPATPDAVPSRPRTSSWRRG